MSSPMGISMDVAKTKAISDWPVPSNLKQVQSFLGFANFYQCFIINFSNMVIPLTDSLGRIPSSIKISELSEAQVELQMLET